MDIRPPRTLPEDRRKAGQAGDDGLAGSVVLAIDENKAKSAGRAIEEGAVSRLACCPSLGDALDRYF
jgi:hypothetical protein